LEIRDPRSEIRDPRSEIRDPRSEIRDLRSEILKKPDPGVCLFYLSAKAGFNLPAVKTCYL
jgi:hypothetical protein